MLRRYPVPKPKKARTKKEAKVARNYHGCELDFQEQLKRAPLGNTVVNTVHLGGMLGGGASMGASMLQLSMTGGAANSAPRNPSPSRNGAGSRGEIARQFDMQVIDLEATNLTKVVLPLPPGSNAQWPSACLHA
jgi:hypothetical protein